MRVMDISIITITYNNIEGLKKTVESVVSQTEYRNIEYIVVDGGSSDGTENYLMKIKDQYGLKYISEADRGISDAFNKGIRMATGDMLLFLNSGDCLIDSSIMKKVIADIRERKIDILSYKVVVTEDISIPSTDNREKIWNMCEMPHQGTFVSREVIKKVGIYSEEYKIRMDFHFFARCRKAGCSFEYIPKTIVKYEPGGTSMRKENRIRFWKEGMAIKFMYGIKLSAKDFIKFIIYSLQA